MNINWHIVDDRFELVYKKPDKIINPMMKEYNNGNNKKISKCPGINDMWSNVFVMRLPFDFTISFDDRMSRVMIDENKTTIDTKEFSDIIVNDPELYTNYPVVQISSKQMFSSDKPCKVSIIPPIFHLHENDAWKNIRYISGVIDIHNWHRPVNFPFEWIDTSKSISFKRGDPIAYAIFNSENLDEKFNIDKKEFSGKIKKSYTACLGARDILPINTRELIDANKNSKCPFSKMSKFRFWKR
jgi:hypothetical protein